MPNRFSLSFNYQLKGLNDGKGAVGYLTGGWGISGTSVFQSGYPLTVCEFQFLPAGLSRSSIRSPCPSLANPAVGYAAGSGDYNADGARKTVVLGLDYPDVSSYHQGTSKSAFLERDLFCSGQFARRTFGSEGNEKIEPVPRTKFCGNKCKFLQGQPHYGKGELAVAISSSSIYLIELICRTLTSICPTETSARRQGAHLPRWWQVGGKISF